MTSINAHDREAILDLLLGAAREAGEIALGYFRPGAETAARIDFKVGGSPVTQADLDVDAFLHERLCGACADAAWLSEETADDLKRLDHQHVFVVDPIDGTRSFAAGDTHWAVSIAFVTDGRPVAGVVHAPALDATYSAHEGGGARLNDQPIAVTGRGLLAGARISAPAGFIKPMQRAFAIDLVPKIPSLACRFAAVAAGQIDGSIASPNAHDWDIAGVDVIMREAGGAITGGNALPLVYNRRASRHPTLYGAGPHLHAALVAAGRRTLAGGA